MSDNYACREGDDLEVFIPLKVVIFGSNFASIEDPELHGLSASGPNCLATLAGRLLAAGQDGDRPLILYRGSERVGRTTIAEAAQSQQEK